MTVSAVIRAATAADAEQIVELSNVCDVADRGEAMTTLDEVASDLATDGFRGGVIDDLTGGLTAYVWVDRQSGHQTVYGDFSLRPGADPSLAAVLLEWLRARANELGPGSMPHVFADVGEQVKRTLFETVGGQEIRRSYWMAIDLDGTPPRGVPDLADGAEIRGMTDAESDLRAMHRVIDTAFADHYNHEADTYETWLKRSLRAGCSDLSLWWLATVDGAPAAGLYGCELPDSGYVDTLGTLREFRGRGLARALLLTSFAEFAKRGISRATLGVDATNPTGALELYRSVGMEIAQENVRYQLPAL